MPLIVFPCPKCGKETEKILSFSNSGPGTTNVCECGEVVTRADFAPTLRPHFYGNPDGWASPSPLKRYNTKVVSQRDGNRHSIG